MNKKNFSDNSGVKEDDFVKICLSPDNKLVPDLRDDLPGKSFWLPANKTLIIDILKKEDLKSYFGVPELFIPDLGIQIEAILTKKVLNSISLTKKSGNLAIGLDAIKAQLIQKKHCLVIAAKGAKVLTNSSFFL